MIPKGLVIAALAAALAYTPIVAPANAGAAYEAGIRQAKKRGLANPACYARVCETYASLNRNSHWSIKRRRSDNTFELELFSKCWI